MPPPLSAIVIRTPCLCRWLGPFVNAGDAKLQPSAFAHSIDGVDDQIGKKLAEVRRRSRKSPRSDRTAFQSGYPCPSEHGGFPAKVRFQEVNPHKGKNRLECLH